MQDYPLIGSVLAGMFSSSVGYSEEQALAALSRDLRTIENFRTGFQEELRRAFHDNTLSWSELLEEHDVAFFEDEAAAKRYAQKMLWDPTFPNSQP